MRELKVSIDTIAKAVSLGYGLIFLYSFFTYPFDAFLQNSLFLQAVIILAFLNFMKEESRKSVKIFLFLLLILIFIPILHISLNYVEIAYRAGIPTQIEMVFGIILILSILILTWKEIGRPLAIMAAVFLIYLFVGSYIPGMWNPGKYPSHIIIGYLYMTREGLWSLPMSIAATYVVAFNIMGSIFAKIKVTNLITDGLSSLNKVRGGPGIVTVFSNMFLGMVSGSAPENAALTGSALMPSLRKYGFSPEKSAAIIATAAAGALIMPPVMGAAAFIMADLLGIPYRDIVISAFIPAFLYFLALLLFVYLDSSARIARKGQENQLEVKSAKEALKKYGHTAIPLVVLTVAILSGYAPVRAAAYSILVAVLISMLRKETRLSFSGFVDAMHEAMNRVVKMGIAIASACIIYGVIMMSGLGVKMSLLIEAMAGGNLFLILIIIMFASIILGMGLPATVAYLIVAITIASAVVKLGILPIAAHLFIFYFATFSTITPPVALALYVSSAIAGSDIMKSGINALKMAFPAFVIPYVFIYHPVLLLEGPLSSLPSVLLFTLIGVISITIAFTGYFRRLLRIPERAVYAISGILLLHPSQATGFLGLLILVSMILFNYLTARRKNSES